MSVIIPAYNCARYLPEAIRSVLMQSGANHEVIVVDDGSTDDTSTAIKMWRDRVVYIRQDNQGVSGARNTGLALARGEYIAFLDADDAWYPGKLALQLSVLNARPDVLGVCSDFGLVDERGILLAQRFIKGKYRVFSAYKLDWERIFHNRLQVRPPIGGPSLDGALDAYYGDAFPSLFLGNFINTSSIVLRRTAIEKVGRFTAERRTQEDYEYWLKVAMAGPIGYVDHPLLFFRRRPLQLTAVDQNRAVAEESLRVVEGIADLARRRLGRKRVARRLADRHRAVGLAWLGANQRTYARRAFLRAASTRHGLDARATGLYLWSFFPSGLSDVLRGAYRRVRRSP